MQIWGVPLWMSSRELCYLKEEQLANIHNVQPTAQVSAL
jgi:hypothetical protein